MTDFPNGISSFGIPVSPFGSLIHNGSTTDDGGAVTRGNKHIWVHGNVGGDGNDGLSPARPLRTMAAAFNVAGSGDIIHFNGNITEQLSTPAGVFDVTIVGEGNQPRHSDAHTNNNGYSSATWKYPSSGGSASTPLLIVQQQGWKLANTIFDGPASAAAVQVFRDGGAGDSERDGSHIHVVGCKFVAGQNHIEFKGGPSQVVIENNLFFGATGDSITDTVGAGIGTDNYFRIVGNHFHNNESHIDAPLNYASIVGNIFGKKTTTGIDLTGGSENVVTMNSLYGTYSIAGGYTAGTNDEWGGNFNSLAGGVTAADPA